MFLSSCSENSPSAGSSASRLQGASRVSSAETDSLQDLTLFPFSPNLLAASAQADEVPYIINESRHDPYDIAVMDSAYQILSAKYSDKSISRPTPTHTYFRVLPQDADQLEMLLSDTNIYYSDIPYECEILNPDRGTYYHDPKCDEFTWLYAVVPYGSLPSKMDSIEIIHHCYIPEYNGKESEDDDNELLEYIAFYLTDNLDYYSNSDLAEFQDELPLSLNRQSSAKHSPIRHARTSKNRQVFGKIMVREVINNTMGNSLPLQYAQVRLHVFTKVDHVNLTAAGNFQSNKKFNHDPHLCIIFKNTLTDDEIWGGWHWRSSAHKNIDSRVPKAGLNYTIPFDDISWRWATANNAVVEKYNMDIRFGLPAPTGIRIWVVATGGKDFNGSAPLLNFASSSWSRLASSVQHSSLILIATPTIRTLVSTILSLLPPLVPSFDISTLAALLVRKPDIFLLENTGTTNTAAIYKTVFHELSHASHYMQVDDTYWSRFITHIVQNSDYGSSDDTYAEYCGVGETWAYYAADYYIAALHNNESCLPIFKYQFNEEYWWNMNILPYASNMIAAYPYFLSIGTIFAAFTSDADNFETLEKNLIAAGVPSSILLQAHSANGEWIFKVP